MSLILNINDLPDDKLPEFWKDNARINALYAPFRDRSVNPQDWDSKLNFWKKLINTWCECNKCCTFTEIELKKYLIYNDRVPACLANVLNEMYKDRDLQTVSQFMVYPQKTWTGWAIDLAVKKPLFWSFNKIKNTLITPVNAETKFVHLPSVQTLSETLFLSVPDELRNKVIDLDEFISRSNLKYVRSETAKFLLHHLQLQEKIEMIQKAQEEDENSINKQTLIKVAFINGKVAPITEVDMGIYKLEQNEKLLLKKIEELENSKAEMTKNAKVYLAKGMRQMAKNSLRKQHALDRSIEKQITVLENVQLLLNRINTAESDTKVIESYRKGLAALKSIFKENGLSEDSVSDTMLEIGETLEIHDDIQHSIAQSVTTTLDSDLEEELAELLNDESQPPTQPTSPTGGNRDLSSEEEDLERRLKMLKFPTVPKESPVKSFAS